MLFFFFFELFKFLNKQLLLKSFICLPYAFFCEWNSFEKSFFAIMNMIFFSLLKKIDTFFIPLLSIYLLFLFVHKIRSTNMFLLDNTNLAQWERLDSCGSENQRLSPALWSVASFPICWLYSLYAWWGEKCWSSQLQSRLLWPLTSDPSLFDPVASTVFIVRTCKSEPTFWVDGLPCVAVKMTFKLTVVCI